MADVSSTGKILAQLAGKKGVSPSQDAPFDGVNEPMPAPAEQNELDFAHVLSNCLTSTPEKDDKLTK